MEINIPATKKPPVLYHWQDALFFVGIVGGFFGFNIKVHSKIAIFEIHFFKDENQVFRKYRRRCGQ